MSDEVLNQISQLFKQAKTVDRIRLFGSRARGDNQPRADYDIALDCPCASESEWRALWFKRDEVETLCAIDVVCYDQASERLKSEIDREGIVLCQRT